MADKATITKLQQVKQKPPLLILLMLVMQAETVLKRASTSHLRGAITKRENAITTLGKQQQSEEDSYATRLAAMKVRHEKELARLRGQIADEGKAINDIRDVITLLEN